MFRSESWDDREVSSLPRFVIKLPVEVESSAPSQETQEECDSCKAKSAITAAEIYCMMCHRKLCEKHLQVHH